MIATATTTILPIFSIATGVGVFLVGQMLQALRHISLTQPQSDAGETARQAATTAEAAATQQPDTPDNSLDMQPSLVTASPSRYYRKQERDRIVATLRADSSILAVGKEGMGKTVLANAVVRQLADAGFTVIELQQATPKNMLKEIAMQLSLPTQTLEGKSLTADDLRHAIEMHLMQLPTDSKAILVIDDAHKCDARFRDWLKTLKHLGVPMFLTATDPPRTDIFLNVPRIELSPLSEYAIREIMEQAALELGLNLKPYELARLQERTGGNPMLANRAIDEEHLGLEPETGDHGRYADGTPLLLLIGVLFVVFRFIGQGTDNRMLYMCAGIGAAIFLGVSRLMYHLPKEGRRIQS